MALFAPQEPGPIRLVRTFELRFGGTESNLAVALARLGFAVGWQGRVGDDELGRLIVQTLRGEGVDVSRVRVDPEAPTGLYVKEFSPLGQSRVYYYRRGSAASRMTPADLDPEYFRSARWLHLTGITPALSATCRATVEAALGLGRELGLTISFDPNLRRKLWSLEEARATLLPLMAQADLVLAGDEELQALLDRPSPEAAVQAALDRGLRVPVLKLGAEGVLLVGADGATRRLPPLPVRQVVDPIGAGDGFDAGFIAGRLWGWDDERSAQLGQLVAAHALGVRGDWEGYPSRAEVEALLSGAGVTAR
jgi:2-dehydro-3-deoxygluconokinase